MADDSRHSDDAPPRKPHGDELLDEVDRLAEVALGSEAGARRETRREIEGAQEVVEALEEGDDLPSSGLLSFYDRLRDRIARAVARRGGRFGEGVADALLLVPDVFILLVRLTLDPAVPSSTRATIGGALAYFLLPIDLFPEAILGAGGFLDDLVLAAIVLSQAMSPALEPIVERHWSGSGRVREVLADVVGSAEKLLGADLYGRLQAMLSRRGLRI